ncbi:hypothetical protein EFS45_11145 [Lactobacillus crispatus]|nr:hypothetical protein [Lactobacillus crispatus]
MSKIFGKIIHEGVLLSVCVFFVQTNHTRKELLFLMFKEINLRNHSSLHKLFYSLENSRLVRTLRFSIPRAIIMI